MYRTPPTVGQDVIWSIKTEMRNSIRRKNDNIWSNSALSKSEFVKLLCSIWNQGMTESNIWHMAFRKRKIPCKQIQSKATSEV